MSSDLPLAESPTHADSELPTYSARGPIWSPRPGVISMAAYVEAWLMFRRHWIGWLVLGFIQFAVTNAVQGLEARLFDGILGQSAWYIFSCLAVSLDGFLITLTLSLASLKIALTQVRTREFVPTSALSIAPNMLSGFAAQFFRICCVVSGALFLLLPGIFICVALSLSGCFVLDQGRRGRDAVLASWSVLKGRGVQLGYLLLLLILSVAMGFPFHGAGQILVSPMVSLSLAVFYRDLVLGVVETAPEMFMPAAPIADPNS